MDLPFQYFTHLGLPLLPWDFNIHIYIHTKYIYIYISMGQFLVK